MWIEALLILAGVGAGIGAAAAPTPKQARQRQAWQALASRGLRMPSGKDAARLWAETALPSVIYLPQSTDADAVAGTSDASAVGVDVADAAAALANIAAVDAQWAIPLDRYRKLKDIVQRDLEHNSPKRGQVIGWRRYPTRLAVLRLTYLAQASGEDPLGIADPTTGDINASWLRLLFTYQPEPWEWQAIAAQMNRPPPSGGLSEMLSSLAAVAGVGLGVASAWLNPTTTALQALNVTAGGAANAAAALRSSGATNGRGTNGLQAGLAPEESALMRWLRAARVELRRRPGLQLGASSWSEFSGAEALSGGDAVLTWAWPEVVKLARQSAPLTQRTAQLTDAQLGLKLTMLARRHPSADVMIGLLDVYYANRVRLVPDGVSPTVALREAAGVRTGTNDQSGGTPGANQSGGTPGANQSGGNWDQSGGTW